MQIDCPGKACVLVRRECVSEVDQPGKLMLEPARLKIEQPIPEPDVVDVRSVGPVLIVDAEDTRPVLTPW